MCGPPGLGHLAATPNQLILPQQLANQLGVQAMPAAVCGDSALDITTCQCQIPDEIQCFVTHALVGETQSVTDRPSLVEHQQIGAGNAFSQSLLPQPFCLRFQQKRAGRGQLRAKRAAATNTLRVSACRSGRGLHSPACTSGSTCRSDQAPPPPNTRRRRRACSS